MPNITFSHPWGSAIGGLGQGLAQGLALGGEMEDRKIRREAAKRQEADAARKGAIDLLTAGAKLSETNPEMMPQFVAMTQQYFPGLNLQAPQVTSAVERYKKAYDEGIAGGLDPEIAKVIAGKKLGIKFPAGAAEKPIAFYKGDQYVGHFRPSQVDPSSGVSPKTPFKPNISPSFVPYDPTDSSTVPSGPQAPGAHLVPLKPVKEEKEDYATPATSKRATELENLIRTETDPDKRQSYVNEYEQTFGGKANITPGKPGALWGKDPDKIDFKRPKIKIKGVGGGGGGGSVVDSNAVKAKAAELIQKGKDPAKVRAWAASKGVNLE
jgi:hypothetical protein